MSNVDKILRFIVIGTLCMGAVIFFLPFLWLLMSSLKSNKEIISVPPSFFPAEVTWEHFRYIITRFNIIVFFKNSLFLSSIKTFIGLYTSLLCGYVFAKFEFFGKKIIFSFILFSMMVPYLIMVIPMYQLINAAHLIDTYLAVILPTLYSAFGIFMMKQYMTYGIPKELMEAARMEGASEFKIFHTIAIPLSVNMIAALGIFLFLWNWEDFLWPYLVLNSQNKFPLSVALNMLSGQNNTNYGGLFAATTVTILPVLIVYFIFQKRFVEGISMSGIK